MEAAHEDRCGIGICQTVVEGAESGRCGRREDCGGVEEGSGGLGEGGEGLDEEVCDEEVMGSASIALCLTMMTMATIALLRTAHMYME